MKKNILLKASLALFMVVFICTNCNKAPVFHVPEDINNLFNSNFSQYSDLEWGSQKGFVVASFRSKEGRYTKAWFSSSAELLMTETNIPYDKLPEKVQSKNDNKDEILETYRVEFKDLEPRYIIELQPVENPKFRFYGKSTDLFKIVRKHWENEPIIVPAMAREHIEKYHDNPKIIDGWIRKDILKLYAAQKGQHEFLCFKVTGEWVADFYKIKETSSEYKKLKAVMSKHFSQISNYSSFFVEYPKDAEDPQNQDNELTAYFIKTDNSSFFVDTKNGEELTDIDQDIKIALADTTGIIMF